jgi:hypothetical protein
MPNWWYFTILNEKNAYLTTPYTPYTEDEAKKRQSSKWSARNLQAEIVSQLSSTRISERSSIFGKSGPRLLCWGRGILDGIWSSGEGDMVGWPGQGRAVNPRNNIGGEWSGVDASGRARYDGIWSSKRGDAAGRASWDAGKSGEGSSPVAQCRMVRILHWGEVAWLETTAGTRRPRTGRGRRQMELRGSTLIWEWIGSHRPGTKSEVRSGAPPFGAPHLRYPYMAHQNLGTPPLQYPWSTREQLFEDNNANYIPAIQLKSTTIWYC